MSRGFGPEEGESLREGNSVSDVRIRIEPRGDRPEEKATSWLVTLESMMSKVLQ